MDNVFQQWPAWMMGPLGLLEQPTPNQPINPGWAFGNVVNVTEQNSSAPGTERDIVASISYGKQLGRITDALAALIAERPKSS
jgi:hypothetical protein